MQFVEINSSVRTEEVGRPLNMLKDTSIVWKNVERAKNVKMMLSQMKKKMCGCCREL